MRAQVACNAGQQPVYSPVMRDGWSAGVQKCVVRVLGPSTPRIETKLPRRTEVHSGAAHWTRMVVGGFSLDAVSAATFSFNRNECDSNEPRFPCNSAAGHQHNSRILPRFERARWLPSGSRSPEGFTQYRCRHGNNDVASYVLTLPAIRIDPANRQVRRRQRNFFGLRKPPN